MIYYIGVALTKTGTGGASMHLPDVGPYWSNARCRRNQPNRAKRK